MKINTRTDKVELTKQEFGVLAKANDLAILLAKHTDGDVASLAMDANKALGQLCLAIRNLANLEELTEAPPY